jgi:uncharacterized membrane protein
VSSTYDVRSGSQATQEALHRALASLPPLADGAPDATSVTAAAAPPAPAASAAARVDPAPGADAPWSTVFGAPYVGMYPTVAAADGETAYLGGEFINQMAGLPPGTFNRIARWDGAAWHRMGEGLDAHVHAIAIVGDDVYVGGEFTTAGGAVVASGLARWDGAAWSAVAGGVRAVHQAEPPAVRALASDGHRLYVAGSFDRVGEGAGALEARGFAALDLRTGAWETYDGGLWFQETGAGAGHALALADGRVHVGGSFDRAGTLATGALATLDTATGTWTTYGEGLRGGDFAGIVDALAVDGRGTLVIGGQFTSADGLPASGVATLAEGRFGTLGPFTRFGDPSTARVVALAATPVGLHAAGIFTTAGNAAADGWAAHDGTAWSVPGDGVQGMPRALEAYGDGVIVAGEFQFSGPRRITYAGIWRRDGWDTFGQGLTYDTYGDGNAFAVAVVGERVVVGGSFDQAGPETTASVAEWRAGRWRSAGGGVRTPGGFGKVYGMARLGDDVYVTGEFSSAGDTTAAGIARWDGERWSALGSGLNGIGFALAVLGGRVYVGGRFSAAGGTPASGVAAWDPATQAWSALGHAPGYDHDVLALEAIGDRFLAIGGQFHAFRQGNRDLFRGLNGLVLFDTQRALDPANPLSGYVPAPGLMRASGTGVVRALRLLGADLYIGGWFDTAGVTPGTPSTGGFAAQNLAVWHLAEEGHVVSTPGGTDQQVQALTTLDGRTLVVGGWFGTAGPIAANGIAELDPATGAWTTYGSGIGAGQRGVKRVEALGQSAEHGLWVGGTFNTAGGMPGCSIALWRATAGRGE